jgi:hypothetical protein
VTGASNAASTSFGIMDVGIAIMADNPMQYFMKDRRLTPALANLSPSVSATSKLSLRGGSRVDSDNLFSIWLLSAFLELSVMIILLSGIPVYRGNNESMCFPNRYVISVASQSFMPLKPLKLR